MGQITVDVSSHPQKNDITLLIVKGHIDTVTAPEFDKHLRSLLSANKFKLIVDLKDVQYISSAGWGIFIRELKYIRKQKGDLVLAGMQSEVGDIYDTLGFASMLKAYPDVETAVEKHFSDALEGRR